MSAIKVGLTGGIGSGKTFVSRIYHRMGIPIYDSDSNAKRLMVESSQIIKGIKREFGQEAYDEKGNLNRQHLASVIFTDEKKLKKINKLVHPAVREDFKKWSIKKKTQRYVINEAALFVENKTYKDFDFLISVLSPKGLRIERLLKRDANLTEKTILDRMDKQSSDQEKIAVSDFIIYNDVTSNIFSQVQKIHKIIVESTK